jgi:hypothetical protein
VLDAERRHGTAALRAAILPAGDDDEATKAARTLPTAAGIRVLLHAALAREQVRAEREFRDVWLQVPAERRKSLDPAEPALVLFLPTAP